jgi:hypothetical protein
MQATTTVCPLKKVVHKDGNGLRYVRPQRSLSDYQLVAAK